MSRKNKEKKPRKKGRLKRFFIGFLVFALVVSGGYCLCVFSDIPFIKKWRTIYIETAMSTMSHQWLATMFIPQYIIDDVMSNFYDQMETQEDLVGTWSDVEESSSIVEEAEGEEEEATEKVRYESATTRFFDTYWELDTYSFRDYLAQHYTSSDESRYDHILIEDFDGELGLKTVNDDDLLVLDTANNLMIIGVTGSTYKGKLIITKDSSQVDLVKSSTLNTWGETLRTYGERYDALLAINASGFTDDGGHGNGGDVKGCLVIDGTEYGNPNRSSWKMVGLRSSNNRMYISKYKTLKKAQKYRWAIQFYPALIINGENVVDGTFGMGIQPRTAIGQSKRGDFLMLVVDGRQVGYSLGCTVAECADVLTKYDAYQAINLDGGSSSLVWYRGQLITKPCSVSSEGRYLPDCLIVRKAGTESMASLPADEVPENEYTSTGTE